MVVKKLAVAAIVAIIVAGCGTNDTAAKGWQKTTNKLYETTLPDGTRCVVYANGGQGGLDCDWASGTEY